MLNDNIWNGENVTRKLTGAAERSSEKREGGDGATSVIFIVVRVSEPGANSTLN